MKSTTDPDFWQLFHRLPKEAQYRAQAAYRRWKIDPYHPGLNFKRVGTRNPIYSVRIGQHWRALGLWEGDTITWFWIGSHEAYNQIIKKL